MGGAHGHVFSSSEVEDQTKFDSSKVGKIKENETKINEVAALLGTPTGQYIYPMVEKKSWKANVYFNVYYDRGFSQIKLYQQLLIVSYDSNGVVTRIDSVEAGK